MRAVTLTSLILTLALSAGCTPGGSSTDSKPAGSPAGPGASAAGTAPQAAPAPETARPTKSGAAPTAETPGDASPAGGARPDADRPNAPAAAASYREITIPESTVLTVKLDDTVASDTSQVEDRVGGTLAAAVTLGGTEALAEGAQVTGHVTDVKPSGKVKGRATLALRFTEVEARNGETVQMRTAAVSRMARSAKRRDAATIGGSAAGGAVVGAIVGGKKGAAVGAIVGGAGGTGVVLATKGEEVRLGAGQTVKVRLSAPLTVRIPVGS